MPKPRLKKTESEKYGLEFQPQAKRRAWILLRFLLGFGAIFLLLLVTSVYFAQRDGLLDQIISDYFHPTQPETEPGPDVWGYSGKAVFLLCATDPDHRQLRFAALVEADAAKKQLRIRPLSSKAKTALGGQETTLDKALREGGVKQLEAAAEALAGTAVDRYVSGDDDGFVKAVNTMGSVTVQVEKRIRYRSAAFGITLAQGAQRLQGDMLLRYFRYLGTLGEEAPRAQGALLKTVLESFLTPQNAEDPAWLEQRFSTLANLLDTDISITDFYAQRELLQALLAGGELTVTVEE